METTSEITEAEIRKAIESFLNERLQPKLDKLKEGEEEKRQKLIEEHEPRNWIANAARRVTQIRRVTHAIKYSHPDAKGSSLYSKGNPAAGEFLVGTHTVKDLQLDAVGNAGSMDVYEFLRLHVGGRTILDMAQAGSPELHKVFGSDEDAKSWIKAFSAIDDPTTLPSSHKLAKQTYWPTGNNSYHLLAPLFASSLAQYQYNFIHHQRFSDDAKSARDAHYKIEAHTHGYQEYPGLAVLKFGSTTNARRNISWLNYKKRNGEAWLLPSLPPEWTSNGLKPPCHVETIFGRWIMGFRTIREPVQILGKFLRKTEHNNLAIRNTRAELTRQIIDEVLMLAIRIQQLPSGWSADPECRLSQAEQFWLDPGRAGEDDDFAAVRAVTDWRDTVTDSFGRWLNKQLNSDKTPMADAEREHWRKELDNELRLLREELRHD